MDKIWAIARNTIAQALRMKIAVVVIVLLVVLLPMMSMIMIGDGTLLGKLQTFSTYGLSLVGILLSILTIAVSTYTLSDELTRKQIFMVVTKPVSRWKIIMGKFLGVVIIDIFLLGIFALLIFGLTVSIPYLVKATAEENKRADYEFFSAREGRKVKEDTDAIRQRVLARYEQLEKENRLPVSMTKTDVLSELSREESIRERSVDLGRGRTWNFSDIYPSSDPNTMLFVRFKLDMSTPGVDSKTFGLWSVGDIAAYERNQGQLATPIYNVENDFALRTIQEFAVPADAVNQDHYLGVSFVNHPNYNLSEVQILELEVLYKVGTFTGNFWRATLLMLIRLVFLAALGVALTTWLSFPVAVLVCLVVFAAGLVNGFLVESIDSLGAVMGMVYMYTIKPLLAMLPRFDGDYSPARYILEGRMIRWTFLLATAAETAGKGLLVLSLGILVFRRREVAKSSV